MKRLEGSFSNRIEGKNQSNSSSWASGYYSLTCYQSISEAGQIVIAFLEGIEIDL